ncbi:MAG: M48 family metallopeptidase [Rhizobiales bacterium]|nr:M48 family metallopeptidase [Hyphomicrobiales bacterium]
MGSFGLSTYIWNNRIKSVILLAGFPFLLLLICFGFALVISAMSNPDVGEGIENAIHLLPSLIPVALVGALVWFVIAWFANQGIIDAATGARRVDRKAEPRLYNLIENLCISRGLTVPAIRIIETDQRNAFASGIREGRYSITVTRGLMNALDDAELEAVLAHELTHIQNRDVQLLVISAVFVGIISLVGDLLIRAPRMLFWGSSGSSSPDTSSSSGGGFGWGGGSRSRGSSSNSKGGGGAIILILIAVAIFIIARLLALVLRFAMSRKREYLADAGAVELTKNPDAMISALRKISGHSSIEAPAQIQEMFLDMPAAGLFATHPPIDARVKRLIQFAGGHDYVPPPEPLPPATPGAGSIADAGGVGPWQTPSDDAAAPGAIAQDGPLPGRGPWG